MLYFSSIFLQRVMSDLAQTMTFSFALWAVCISSILPSPASVETTLMPIFSRIGVYCHISPVTLYSPMRFIPYGWMLSGSLVPMSCSSTASPPRREPRFLLPTNPGACTTTIGRLCFFCIRLQILSISSPIMAVTQVS